MSHISFQAVDPNPDSADSHMCWLWRNDPVTRHMSRSTQLIAWDKHQAWYQGVVEDPKRVLLIASLDNHPIGVVRFDERNEECAEINLTIRPEMRGKNYGTALLAAACEYAFNRLGISSIYAEVKADNIPSIHIFEGAGFTFQGFHEGLRTYLLT